MSAISGETADAWRQIAATVSAERPSPGRRVRVTTGRKHMGKCGTVIRHERNRFSDASRYGGDALMHMRDLRGTRGFRVQISEDAGTTFWIDADKVEVLQ